MTIRTSLLGAALIAALAGTHALGAQSPADAAPTAGDAARPRDATANKPSESGAQATNPQGAVTGAGQPQGGAQSDAKSGSAKKKAAKKTKRRTKANAAQ